MSTYETGVYRTHGFSAYNFTFEPGCHLGGNPGEHSYHKPDQEVANTTNDLALGIWVILKHQSVWLEEKFESLKNNQVSQDDLNRQTEDIRNIVKRASRVIEDQNVEILDRFTGFRREIEKMIDDQNLDRKFAHTEKVIRDCLDDVEYRISKLERMGRNILEEVRNSGGRTDVERLVLENNQILRRLDEEKLATQEDIRNIRIPGLEQLVRKEDLRDLETQIDPRTLVRRTDLKQEYILDKLEQNNNMLKNLDIRELENIIRSLGTRIGPFDRSVEEELEQVRQHLNQLSDLIARGSRRY